MFGRPLSTPRRGASIFTPHKRASSTTNITGLLASLQQQQSAANQAGQQRYDQLMAGLAGTQQRTQGAYDQSMAALDQTHNVALSQIGNQQVQARGQAEQGIIGRGLSNTTVRQSALREVDATAEQQRQQAESQLTQRRADLTTQKASAETKMAELMGNAMLSKQNVSPNTSQYLSLISRLASTPQAPQSRILWKR